MPPFSEPNVIEELSHRDCILNSKAQKICFVEAMRVSVVQAPLSVRLGFLILLLSLFQSYA